MTIRGFVELTPEVDPDLMGYLVRVANRVSRHGRVILALNGVPVRSVTRHLDPVGQFAAYETGGLRYVAVNPINDEVLDLARVADWVIADSASLSAALFSRAIRHMRAREGTRYLRTLLPEGEAGGSRSNPGFLASW